jgi:hypothetical protein
MTEILMDETLVKITKKREGLQINKEMGRTVIEIIWSQCTF